MNVPVLVVGCVTLLALIAHVFGGTRETASLEPEAGEAGSVRRWKQAMCAFQMLAVDLALASLVLFLVALTDIIPFEREAILLLGLLYLLWGVVWLVQLLWLKSDTKTYWVLPQWLLWFGCSALLFYGAT